MPYEAGFNQNLAQKFKNKGFNLLQMVIIWMSFEHTGYISYSITELTKDFVSLFNVTNLSFNMLHSCTKEIYGSIEVSVHCVKYV